MSAMPELIASNTPSQKSGVSINFATRIFLNPFLDLMTGFFLGILSLQM
jgi:hypothetical protein